MTRNGWSDVRPPSDSVPSAKWAWSGETWTGAPPSAAVAFAPVNVSPDTSRREPGGRAEPEQVAEFVRGHRVEVGLPPGRALAEKFQFWSVSNASDPPHSENPDAPRVCTAFSQSGRLRP